MIDGFFCHRRLPLRLSTFIQPHLPANQNSPSLDFFDGLLRWSATLRHTQQIHAQIITIAGLSPSPFLAARLVSAYSRSSLLCDARAVFRTAVSAEDAPENLLLWNSIIRANVTHGEAEEALALYLQMAGLGLGGDGFTLPLVIRACASISDPILCRVVHGRASAMGFELHLHVANELMGMYSKLARMEHARCLFERMPHRTVVSWNVLFSGYAANYDCDSAMELFRLMEMGRFIPNSVTWTSLLSAHARCGRNEEVIEMFSELRVRGISPTAECVAVVLSACSDLEALDMGKGMHGHIIKGGFDDYVFVNNSLVCVYGKAGNWIDTKRAFSGTNVKNVASWNALISCFARNGLCDEALDVFSRLQKMEEGTKVAPNVISWSAVISGFASNGRGEKALELFRQMLCIGIEPNSVTIASVLSACSELAVLNLGKEIHGHLIRCQVEGNVLVENGLINMYAKSGSLQDAQLVFNRMGSRDLVSWNSMIAGYGIHGYGEKAIEIFNTMTRGGPKPDGVTFVVLLSACSHAGLVDEGRLVFGQMGNKFMISPQLEHYACMVDLLGRAGLLKEASELVKIMPMKPNAHVLGALLNSCRIHRNTDVAEETASDIFNHDSEMTGSYMLLSNLYASCGRWDDSAKVRVLAKSKGLKKSPGQSWIEMKKRIYVFSAGNVVDLNLEELYLVLKDLGVSMEAEGYTPDKSFVLHDVNEEEKTEILNGHSEKLAIAFGHINIPRHMPIRVMKNIRICGDCHNWIKVFSKVTGRQVIVRDGHRFHHFASGLCSCRDYW